MSAGDATLWTRGRLGDLLPIKYGKSLPDRLRDSNGIVPVFGSSGRVGVHTEALTQGPALIVGRKGSVGSVYFSDVPCWPIDTVYFTEAPVGQNLRYFKYLLDSLRLVQLDKSTAVPGLSRDDYNAVTVVIAPPLQQAEIVAEIEKQFSRLDEAVANLQRVKANLKRYGRTVLGAAFDFKGSGVVQPVLKLQQVAAAIVDCPHSTPRWTPTGNICVRTTDFLPGHLDLSSPRYVSRETFDLRNARLAPRAGDILYSREGGILGVACQVPGGVDLCLGQRMLLIRLGPAIDPRFAMHWLNSNHIVGRVRTLTGGSASPHLNVRDIREFPIPVPSLVEQHRIVAEIDRRLSIVNEVEAEVDANLKRAQALRQAVLAKAFDAGTPRQTT